MARQEIRYARETVFNDGKPYCDTVLCTVKGPRRGKRSLGKPTPPAQEWVNERNARKQFARIANANFSDGEDVLVHLTFDKEHLPSSRRACKRKMDSFLRRLKRAWLRKEIGKELKYLYVIEGEDGKRLHVHMLMTGGMNCAEIKALWGMAEIVNVDVLQAGRKGYEALSVYLTKQGKLADGEHRWYGSRNLLKPERKEKNAGMPVKELEELGDYIANRMEVGDGVIATSERYAPIEERYQGYFCADAEAKYLEQFREWVIHIQLYAKDSAIGRVEKARRRAEEREIERRKAIFSQMETV